MKRSIYFMGLLLLAGAMVFTACKKDDDDPSPAPSDKTPVLTFIGDAGYVTQDTEMSVNSEFMVGINAAENPNTKKDIESFKVVRTFNNVPTTVFDTNFSTTAIMWEETMFAIDIVGEERWTFTITDKDGEKKELSFIITTTDNTPALTFIGGAGYTDADADMIVGSEFKVGINASENANTNKDIESFVVIRTFNNVSTTVFEEGNIGEPNYTWESDLLANAAAGEERWTFTVTDKDDYTKEVFFIITTTPIVTIVAYTDVDMGSYNDPNFGSFMATATGTVMTKAEASADQASVDFAFYLGVTNGSTFGAPSNSDVQDVFDLAATWTTFNETLFEMSSLSGAEFDAIGDIYIFPDFTGTKDDINNLENGDVVYFKTVNDKLGFIKVNAINGKGDVVNIDLKVML